MTGSGRAVALAVRMHARGGAERDDEEAKAVLKAAGAAVARRRPELLSGPTEVTAGGLLLLALASPTVALPAMRAVADELRPRRSTFCLAVAGTRAVPEGSARGSVEAALLAAERALALATAGIAGTDVREARVAVLAPGPEPVLAALLGLVLDAYDMMTPRQRQVIGLVRESETQQEVAEHLAVSRQAINQSLSAARWPHLRRAEEAAAGRIASLASRSADESPRRSP